MVVCYLDIGIRGQLFPDMYGAICMNGDNTSCISLPFWQKHLNRVPNSPLNRGLEEIILCAYVRVAGCQNGLAG